MSARRAAGWTSLGAGLLLLIGIVGASLAPAAASGANPTSGGPASVCAGAGMMGAADGHAAGHMGGAGMMDQAGHMGGAGMTNQAGHMGGAGMTNQAGHMGGAGTMGASHMTGGMMGAAPNACQGTTLAPAIAGATEVRVRATNFAFAPSEIRLPKGDAVNLALENPAASGTVHDLTVPGLGIHIMADPGQTSTVGLRGLAAGRYDAYCAVAGHAALGMRATVIVE